MFIFTMQGKVFNLIDMLPLFNYFHTKVCGKLS